MTSDNGKCMSLVQELMGVSNMFGYGEVNAHSRYSTLMNTYKKIEDPKFRHYVLKENKDVYHALKKFFHKTWRSPYDGGTKHFNMLWRKSRR